MLDSTTNGMLTASPNTISAKLPLRRARDRQDVVRRHRQVRHHDVPDRLPEALRRGRGIRRLAGIAQHLDRDPQHQQAAGESAGIRSVSSRAATVVSADPQHHRRRRAARRPDAPLARRQRTHRHRDHQRVVAGQQQVDQDDREPAQQEVHGTRPTHARDAAEIALRRAHVLQDLRAQRLRAFRTSARRARAAETRRGCARGVSPSSGSSRNVSMDSSSLAPNVGR